jgi:HSP20 family protein
MTTKEEQAMLMRTDPFRDLDRLSQQLLGMTGTATRPTVMAMDAWRDGEQFYAEFDLPGVDPDSVDLEVERNVLTIKVERPEPRQDGVELVAAERPRGVFTRQLILGDNLDTEHIQAQYEAGVLRLRIPVAEQAKSRKVMIASGDDKGRQAINA